MAGFMRYVLVLSWLFLVSCTLDAHIIGRIESLSIEPPALMNDGSLTFSLTQAPEFQWKTDSQSRIEFYELAIGTAPGLSDVLDWTNVGRVDRYQLNNGVVLQDGIAYYGSVRAVTSGGLVSVAAVGDGFTTLTKTPTFSLDSSSILLVSKFYGGRAHSSTVGPGTYYNSQGILKTSTYNHITNSHVFSNATWSKLEVAVSEDVEASPSESVTADKITELANTNEHRVRLNTIAGIVGGTVYNYSVHLKAAERTKVRFDLSGAAFTVVTGVSVDLANGTWISETGTILEKEIIDLGNGWYRVWFSTTAQGSGNGIASINLLDGNGNASYLGIATYGVFAWGAQLVNQASPGIYAPTTGTRQFLTREDYDPSNCPAGTCAFQGILLEKSSTNLALRSQNLTGANWTAQRLSLTEDSTLTRAPDNSYEAELLTETSDGVTAQKHALVHDPMAFLVNRNFTGSVFAKAHGRHLVRISIYKSTDINDKYSAVFDLQSKKTSCETFSGTVVAGSVQARVHSLPNDWSRLELIGIPSSTAGSANMEISLVDQGCNDIYAGNGTDGVFLFGAQVEQSSYASSYIATTTATKVRNGDTATIERDGNWIHPSEGSVIMESVYPADAQLGVLYWPIALRMCDFTDCNDSKMEFQMARNEPVALRVRRNMTNILLKSPLVKVLSINKFGMAYSPTELISASDGVSSRTVETMDLPLIDKMELSIGSSWLRKIDYWNETLTQEQVKQLSK